MDFLPLLPVKCMIWWRWKQGVLMDIQLKPSGFVLRYGLSYERKASFIDLLCKQEPSLISSNQKT